MTYVLGIDGGGTKTYACIVSTDGHILGEGSAGPSNYHDVGVEVTKANIGAAIAMAAQRAQLTKPEFAAAFLGLASIVSAVDRDVVRSIARDLQLPANDRLGVDHDCRIALAGGLSGRPGIVQIAGTGASTYGRNADGKEWRSGGWGYLLADEGGGYWFGLNAMKAALRAEDGRSEETVLRQRVIDRLELATINDIMHRLHVVGMSRSEIASLCPLLIDAAKEGDQLALAVVEEGMAHIAECVEAVAKRLEFDSNRDATDLLTRGAGFMLATRIQPAPNSRLDFEAPAYSTACELALVGGLFNAGDVVIQPLHKAIHRRLPNCTVILAELQPVLGACLLALNCLDISAGKKLVAHLVKR